MGAHQFARVGLRGKQREFAAEDGGGADGGEAARVFSGGTCFAAAERLQMCFDGGERRAFAVADGADDEVRQGAGEVEVAVARLGVDDAL